MNDLERSLAYPASDEDLAIVRALPRERLPCFSVVIPSFNQKKYIGATLDSVLAQDYPRMEIFIADGGSSDGSVEIVADYAARHPTRIRYDSRPDGGHYHGVNKGIANTTGDIVAWINSDDLYLPGAFWKVAAFFHFNRGAMVVYGRNKYVNDALETVTDYPVDWSPLHSEQRRRMLHFCLPPQPSLFFRRTAVTLCGALDHKILDYELWLRWQRDLSFYFLDDFLSLSRLQDQAISVNADAQLLKGICRVVHNYYGIVPLSWAMRYAYNQAYGAAWARGESPPITPRIRSHAWAAWMAMNLAWAPAMLGLVGGGLRRWLREGFRTGA